MGVVSEEVAISMATGVRDLMNSTWAISTTGVAGPGPTDGVQPGTVWVAIEGPISQTLQLELSGTREIVRNATIAGAIAAFARILKTL
jgi:nicotinamide-nucleotide amidase